MSPSLFFPALYILNKMSHGLEWPFGHLGSPLLAVSPPGLPSTPSFPASVAVLETGLWLLGPRFHGVRGASAGETPAIPSARVRKWWKTGQTPACLQHFLPRLGSLCQGVCRAARRLAPAPQRRPPASDPGSDAAVCGRPSPRAPAAVEGGEGRQPLLAASPLLPLRRPGPVRPAALTPAAPRRRLPGAAPSPQPSFLRRQKPDTGTAPRSPCAERRLCPAAPERPGHAAAPIGAPLAAPRPHHAMCPAEPGGTHGLPLAPRPPRPSALPGQGPAGRQLPVPRRRARSVAAGGARRGAGPAEGAAGPGTLLRREGRAVWAPGAPLGAAGTRCSAPGAQRSGCAFLPLLGRHRG
ncbi:skin secretory protein xP2-like [Parus major]|uniref:skin secretory protein xP2-like n=1 Tax=Parus major TaxID=9157 RepID=UPI0014448250|nr:skin secretory protein xP2-like [Parus major]